MVYFGKVIGFYSDEKWRNLIGGGFFWKFKMSTKYEGTHEGLSIDNVTSFDCIVESFWFTEQPDEEFYFKAFGQRDDDLEIVDGVYGKCSVDKPVVDLNELLNNLELKVIEKEFNQDVIHDRINIKLR